GPARRYQRVDTARRLRRQLPLQLRHEFAGPVPILEKSQLQGVHRGPAQVQAGIAPRRQHRVFVEVFIANITAAEHAGRAVDDNDLAVVAKIQLQPVARAFGGVERADVDTAGNQGFDVAAPQLEAADLVIQKQHGDAFAHFRDQFIVQLGADIVIANDVVLEQYVVARVVDCLEQRRKNLFAIDQ